VFADLEKAKLFATTPPPNLPESRSIVRSVHEWLSAINTEENRERGFSELWVDPLFTPPRSFVTLQSAVAAAHHLISDIDYYLHRPPRTRMAASMWDEHIEEIQDAREHLLVLNREFVSFELAEAMALPGVQTKLNNLTPAELHVMAWLRKYQAAIVRSETELGVTRVAIAGAIAWEALINYASTSIRGVGPGKVHLYDDRLKTETFTAASQVEGLGPPYPPKRSLADRDAALRSPETAINYIGSIMGLLADIADHFGRNIYCDAAMLTHAYRRFHPVDWVIYLAKKPPAEALKMTPAESNGQPPMDRWVVDQSEYLKECSGAAKCKRPVRNKWHAFYRQYYRLLLLKATSAGVTGKL
jgi:hypothetical protein